MIKLSRYFPTPSFLAMSSCALDISDQTVKYGELHMSAKGLHLGKFGEEKIPAGIIVSGKIEKEDLLTKILKDLRDKEHLHFVRVALPEEQMYLFNLLLPKEIIGKDVREAILLQLEEHIPLSAMDVFFDYEILSEGEKDLFVQVVAIPITAIQTHLAVFAKAGITPTSFELEGQAIARAVIPEGDESTMMIVDFGETRTGISVASRGKILFTSTLDFGGSILTNMIAKNFSISYEEAEKKKVEYCRNKGAGPDDIFSLIINGLSVLRDELNKNFTYWDTHDDESGKKHEKISRIILCGGNSNLPGLTEYISASMKVQVEHANTWRNISNMKDSVPDMPYEESLSYSTTLGLALGDYLID